MAEEKAKKAKKSSSSGISIKGYALACARNWYWFVISIIICTCLAFLYAKSQPQLYKSSALILVSTGDNGTAGSQSQVFSDLGMRTGVHDIPNEIYKIRSSKLMGEVIKRLGLNVQYYGHVFLRDVNIYKSTPVQVTPLKEIESNYTVLVEPLGGEDFKFKIEGENKWHKAKFGNKYNTSMGPLAITKTKIYSDEDYKGYRVIVRVFNTQSLAKSYVGNLTATNADRGSDVLQLTLTSENFELSKDILNALIIAYNQDAINDKNSVARSTEAFIVDRIDALANDLSKVDTQIAGIKVASSSANMYADASSGIKYEENVADVEMQLSLAGYIRDYIANMTGNELIPSNTGITNTGIESDITKYNEAMLRYQTIATASSKENPVMIELNATLTSMKGNIMRTLNNYINSLRIKHAQARSQERIASSNIATVPTQEKAITEVTRQQKIKEQLYLYLLNKREENALQLAITEPNAKVVENAAGSSAAFAPAQSNIISAGFLLGLLLPAVIIYLIFWFYSMDTMIHSRKDIEDNCTIPIVGEIPEKRADQLDKEIIVSETGRDRISESFRILRSNLDYMITPDKFTDGTVIQLTSTMSGEGKSFVAVNLALSCAHIGKKVIAIDVDLRKGNFSQYVGISKNGVGLSAYLSGKVNDIHDVINKGILHENLDLIGVGAIPPNPTNLLMSDRFKTMIEVLKKEYDYILLDTVPFGIIADASLINRHSQLTIYIMRDGKIDKRYLEDLQKMYDSNKIKELTILLNDIKVNSKRYGYGYGYSYGNGYGYGYGYGYGEDEESHHKDNALVKKLKKFFNRV